VAEAVGQANEYVVSGESGILVPPGEADTFADTVARLLVNDRLREVVGAAAAARIRAEFLWDRLAGTAEAAYGLATGVTPDRDAAYV
jgi:glycosyltransferase involved in cell wall biosynthesis